MNRKKYIISINIIGILSLFFAYSSIAAAKELSGLTQANIEGLATNENISPLCNTANGYCFTGGFPVIGIHFAKD